MDVTTEYRSHWIAADGTRYATRRGPDGRARFDLRPVVNVAEVRAYANLGEVAFQESDYSPQYWARRLVNAPRTVRSETVASLIEELTDCVPTYHSRYNGLFLELRNRWPGFDGETIKSLR